MKITVTYRKSAIREGDTPPGGDLQLSSAGVTVSEGCLAVYPDIKSGNCRMIPLDLIAEIHIEEDIEKVPTPIRARQDA